MCKLFSLFLTLVLIFMLFPPVLADHSVVPDEGILDETAALDAVVTAISRHLGCEEDEIRGHYYYWAVYYQASSWREYPAWEVMVLRPFPAGTYTAYISNVYELNAVTGEVLKEEISKYTYPDYKILETPVIPRKDQLQPAKAIARAREMIREALDLSDEEMNDTWRHYVLRGWNKSGESWYVITLDHQDLWKNAWHVILDMDSGSVIWHTDPERFAARIRMEENGVVYPEWYQEQKADFITLWGDSDSWDYLQWASFEEHCHGSPGQPGPHCGLPGEEDCSLEEALEGVRQYLSQWSGYGPDPDGCVLSGSRFYLDGAGIVGPVPIEGFTDGTHVWDLHLYWPQSGETDDFLVNASTGEVIEGEG